MKSTPFELGLIDLAGFISAIRDKSSGFKYGDLGGCISPST